MLHSGSLAVDAMRSTVHELEEIRDAIFKSTMQGNKNMDSLLMKYRDCVRECLHPYYNEKPQRIGQPVPEKWKPPEIPVTVTAVNIIIVLDISDSMFDWGGFQSGGKKRKLIQEFATKIKKRAEEEGVPTVVSLVAYADPTDKYGKNRPTFWEIVLNKSSDVGQLANKIGSINKNKWVNGLSQHEEGMTAIYKTIDTVYDKRVVNGKPTENIVILISDERQRYKPHVNSHKNYQNTVTETQFLTKMKNLKIKNIFGLLPFDKGYNYVNYAPNPKNPISGGKGWNSYLRKSFRSTKEYWNINTVDQLDDWVRWSLDPDSFGS